MSEPLVSLTGVSLGYGRRAVLSGVDLAIADGDFLGIVGPNGAGKSTLLKAVLGFLPPLAGTIRYGAPRRTLRFGYVPQMETIDTVFPVTAFEVTAMRRYPLVGPFRRLGPAGRAACHRALDKVGLGGLAERRFRDLSGGQQQRVLIARALASEPSVLVLDEPTNGMDLESEHALMELVAGLHARGGLTVILVSQESARVHCINTPGGGGSFLRIYPRRGRTNAILEEQIGRLLANKDRARYSLAWC